MSKIDWNPEVSLGGMVSSVSYKMRKQTANDLIDAGMGKISFARFWVMHHLYKEPTNQASLCRLLNQKAPSMMEMLNRLEADKMIKAKVDPNDPRKKEWSLTANGKRDFLHARTVVRAVGKKMDTFFLENGISEKQVEQVKRVLYLLESKHFAKE